MINSFFVKCESSGIQAFIFDVPSKGAARELKARSNYVAQQSKHCLEQIKVLFGKEETNLIYEGGGNFYVKISSKLSLEDVKEQLTNLSRTYCTEDLMLYFAVINDAGNFSDNLKQVNIAMGISKFKRPLTLATFERDNSSYEQKENCLTGINAHTPNNKTFEELAEDSDGDKKLAAIKLDVDRLGQIFQSRTLEEYQHLSQAFKSFFDVDLLSLIKEKNIANQVYVVFSGGDDCFLIGCWNIIFSLAFDLRESFKEFQLQLKKDCPSLKNEEITFSAGLVIFTPKYPVLRVAEEAEAALHAAKMSGRNRVNVFGHNLQWNEFGKSKDIAAQLYTLVKEKGESHALVQRIKSSDLGYESLQEQAHGGKISMPKVWRLKYYLKRNAKNLNEVEAIFQQYSNALISSFMNGKESTNPLIYPVAARWAELRLKNN